MVERRLRSKTSGVQNPSLSCCVLDQDTLLPESTGYTQEAVAPSRHHLKIADWNVKLQPKQTNKQDI